MEKLTVRVEYLEWFALDQYFRVSSGPEKYLYMHDGLTFALIDIEKWNFSDLASVMCFYFYAFISSVQFEKYKLQLST